MKKRNLVFLLAVLTILTAISPKAVFAAHVTKGESAYLNTPQLINPQIVVQDNRAQILEEFLKSYNSPLASHAKTFIDEADKNNIDWKIVPAIAGVESYFGQMIPPYSYNGWGFGVYGSNVRSFASWDDGITTVTHALRTDYIGEKGTANVYTIGAKYAADPAWAVKVSNFVAKIDAFEKENAKPSVSISL